MKTNQSKQGYALLTVLFLMTAMALVISSMVQMGRQRAFTARRLTQQTKAQAYAEAGIDYAYAILANDFDQRNNPSAFTNASTAPETFFKDGCYTLMMAQSAQSYGEGSFDLQITPVSNRYVIIASAGACGDSMFDTEVVIEDLYAGSGGSTSTDYSNVEGFNYAILAGGEFSFKGCGYIASTNAAKMHSNSLIDINGSAKTRVDVSSATEISVGNNTINGNLTAPSLDLHKKASISGTETETSVDHVEIPDVDLTPYLTYAASKGELYSNGFSTSSSYTPKGGVIYVIGDVNISSHAVITGSIIATGNISVSGHVQIKPTTSVFAMASENGNISNTSSSTIQGLVYAKTGNYKQTANGRLEGQIIVAGTVKKGGNSDILLFQKNIPVPPGSSSTTPTQSLPVISAWQK